MRIVQVISLLILTGLLFCSTVISGLKAEYSAGAVKIDWQSGVELNVKEYEVQKSSDNLSYHTLSTQNALGSNYSYTIVDINPHSKGFVLYYRVIIRDYDGHESISDTVTVNIETSGVSATWGSIKALFR